MARDPSGNYTLPPGINPVQPGTVIDVNWANPTLDDIAVALTDSLSRSGKGGWGTSGPLVMNGNKITNIGFATAATDVPQAQQVRDQSFIWLTSVLSNQSGNDYVGTALLTTPPNNGAMFQFLADKNNAGPMTLAVNGAAPLPILLHGSPVPPGLVLAGAVIPVVYVNSAYRLISIAPGTGTVNSVQSTDPALISVVNDTTTNIAILTPHANVAGGMVKLDGSTKVPVAQLPFQDLFFVGIWDAAPGTNPPTTYNNGDFFVITVGGTLTILRDSGNNIYTLQSTAVVVGDAIILRKGSVDPNAPDGWYFDPGAARPAVASTVSMNATSPLFAGITNLQTWLATADPQINNRLLTTGGTLTGAVHSAPAGSPSASDELVSKLYVDQRVTAVGGVNSFNGRQGAITLTSPDVTGALGYIPFPTTAAIAGVPTPITGNVSMTENLSVAKGIGALYFAPTFIYFDTVSGVKNLDFFQGQSQRWVLVGPTDIQQVLNVPQGSIIRVMFATAGHTLLWPSYVIWPNGITPDLGSGTIGLAIVVIESFSGDQGAHMASATIY